MEKELPNEIDELKAIIKMLLVEIEQLKAENAELRNRLGLNSENSNTPPSSDGLKKKPALPKLKTSKNGGQKGHKGNTLKQVSHPDTVIIQKPEICTCCGELLHQNKIEIVSKRQVFDLPPQKLIVTEYQQGKIICQCGNIELGHYPVDVTQPAQYGYNVKALCVLLSVQYKMPQEQIGQLFDDLYQSPLNTSTVIHYLNTAYTRLEPLEIQIKNQLLQEKVVHFDETGVRVEGKTKWLHTACNEKYSYLFVHEKRGFIALNSEQSLIKDFKNKAVHDCWASYFKFDTEHIICNAHILRELTQLIEQNSQWAKQFHGFLLDCYYKNIAIETVEYRYTEIINQANLEEPQQSKRVNRRGKPKKTKGRCLLERLIKYKDGVLAFIFDSAIPFTNNQAERDIRCVKIKMKVSGCFRTQLGVNAYARIQSVISTFRKQNIEVFKSFSLLFSQENFELLRLNNG